VLGKFIVNPFAISGFLAHFGFLGSKYLVGVGLASQITTIKLQLPQARIPAPVSDE
jgi:hypothetical protein